MKYHLFAWDDGYEPVRTTPDDMYLGTFDTLAEARAFFDNNNPPHYCDCALIYADDGGALNPVARIGIYRAGPEHLTRRVSTGWIDPIIPDNC